jgi:hypothetical protein
MTEVKLDVPVASTPPARRLVRVVVASVLAVIAAVATVGLSASSASAQTGIPGVDAAVGGLDFGGAMAPIGGIDPLADALLGTDVRSMAAASYNDVTDLVINDLIDREALQAAERARADLERRRRAAMAGQTEVGPDGCPISAPPRGVQTRTEIDLNDVCARSVAEARTPEAARAIKYALTHLGNPYSQPKRNLEGFYDCSSFYSRAFEETGTPVNSRGNGNWPLVTWHFTGTDGFQLKPFLIPIDPDEARAGDALLTASVGHVVMALVDGLMAEAPRDGEVTRVTERWFTPGYAAWVDPSRVP